MFGYLGEKNVQLLMKKLVQKRNNILRRTQYKEICSFQEDALSLDYRNKKKDDTLNDEQKLKMVCDSSFQFNLTKILYLIHSKSHQYIKDRSLWTKISTKYL